MIRLLIIQIILISSLFCQDETYTGQVSFNYNGTNNGNFSSLINDSTLTGIAFNQDNGDTSYFIFSAITQQGNNQFDIFLAVLRDTIFPIQPRSWEIPGDGDESNPLSLETILVLMPGLDSSFVLTFLETFSDTSEDQNVEDLFAEIFETLSDDLYLGLQGNIEINISNDTISGSFNSILIKPAFNIPPHLISVDNGEFSFQTVTTPELKLQNNLPPNELSLLKAYPNPFNPVITIQFFSEINEATSLIIYDLNGQKISTLFQGHLIKGIHKFKWDAVAYSSGIYFAVVKSTHSLKTKKIIFTK